MSLRHQALRALSPLLLACALGAPAAARAGGGGFFVTYDSSVERGETELMLMNDFTRPARHLRDEGMGNYASHMLELEYGVTDQLAVEAMVEGFEDFRTRQQRFTGYRLEARYRLFRDEVPLNPMLYAEYEDLDPATRFKMEVSGWRRPPYAETGAEPSRERILESRVVLSQRFGPVNVAFNWINETDLGGGTTGFGYAAGAMWMPGHGGHGAAATGTGQGAGSWSCPMHRDVRAGGPGACPKCGMALEQGGGDEGHARSAEGSCACARDMSGCGCGHCKGEGGPCTCNHGGQWGLGLEAYGGLGDTRAFRLSPSRQEHYLGPVFLYHLSARWMVHAQLAFGLTAASDNLLRVNVGYEF